MVPAAKILVLDDEPGIRFFLEETLTRAGYGVVAVESGEAALEHVATEEFDLALIDLKLSGIGGMEVLAELREQSPTTSVVVLTAHASLDSAIEALRSGGHDYLLKPSSTKEILSSVARGLEKRRQRVRQEELLQQMGDIARQLADGEAEAVIGEATADQPPRYVRFGDLLVDRAKPGVTSSGQPIHLTPSELRLLLCLMENAGDTVDFPRLSEAIHGEACDKKSAKDAISTHMWRLRRKLDAFGRSRTRIVSVRGEGYALRAC